MIRTGVARATVLGAVALSIAWQGPRAFTDAAREIRDRSNLDYRSRENVPLRSQDFPTEAFDGAEQIIPRNAIYTVVVGTNLELSANQRTALTPMLRYRLLPRRFSTATERVGWVIAWGASTETLDVPLGKQTEVSPGIVIVKVDR